MKDLIVELRRLGNGGIPSIPQVGICSNMCGFEGYGCMKNLFHKWPKFSGDPTYPVPFKKFWLWKQNPVVTYWKLDKWTGRYGKLRREFCLWLADELEKINDQDNAD